LTRATPPRITARAANPTPSVKGGSDDADQQGLPVVRMIRQPPESVPRPMVRPAVAMLAAPR